MAAGRFTTLDEIPRTGMQYLNTPATGARIHLAWGQHFQEDPDVRCAVPCLVQPHPLQPRLPG